MAGKLKFIDEVPTNRTGRRGYFDEDVVRQLTENEGKWAQVDTSAASAKKFCDENKDFFYKTHTTDKTRKTRNGSDAKVVEVYVTYNPKGKARKTSK